MDKTNKGLLKVLLSQVLAMDHGETITHLDAMINAGRINEDIYKTLVQYHAEKRKHIARNIERYVERFISEQDTNG